MGNHDIWDELERDGTGEHLGEEMFEYLSAYADGECNAKERRLVEAYISENLEARELLADLRSQSAMVGADVVDPPEWLRAAILRKTVERRGARWPFASGLAAATAATAVVAITYLPNRTPVQPDRDVLAQNEVPLPKSLIETPSPSAPPAASVAPELKPIDAKTEGASPSKPALRRNSEALRTVSAPVAGPESIASESLPATSEEVTDAESTTYAVVEYGSGRFEPKQPDPVDASANQNPETAKPDPRPEVLPDAREKLRDKVRKLNEEKIEVGEKEKSGS